MQHRKLFISASAVFLTKQIENITTTMLQNSSTEIKLSLIGTDQYQSLILKPSYKLYIIETTFGDDGYHFDSSLGDDGFVIVDSGGYISQ